jgi:predicted hydrocarbon binding protein
MVIKDRVIGWFIRNILIPGTEIIKHPAFIICRVGGKKESTYLREFFWAEKLYSILEKKIIEQYGEKGHQVLYDIGKKFGYLYSSISNFPNMKKYKIREIENFIPFFILYIEATYAKKMSYKLEDKIYKMFMDNYIVCTYNGIGHFFSDGGSAGVWAWMLQDPTVEAIQPKCQGRGDPQCEVIAAPYETLVKMGYKPLKCRELENLELDEQYEQFNQIRSTRWVKHSLRSLIDSGFFEFKHGQVTYEGERFFLCEASFRYILEKELTFYVKTKN